ncbi:MAG: alpha/beta hydrolase fold domain-containing protein [Halieaceae bacterium]|jgi:acetyl esterase/lipase
MPRSKPLGRPYHAKPKHLPRHTISVNELDELRDEGLVYIRKLMSAGVPTIRRTVSGAVHCAYIENIVSIMPDVYGTTIRDIHGLSTSLMSRPMLSATSQPASCEEPNV